jgi:hypothetical protein
MSKGGNMERIIFTLKADNCCFVLLNYLHDEKAQSETALSAAGRESEPQRTKIFSVWRFERSLVLKKRNEQYARQEYGLCSVDFWDCYWTNLERKGTIPNALSCSRKRHSGQVLSKSPVFLPRRQLQQIDTAVNTSRRSAQQPAPSRLM